MSKNDSNRRVLILELERARDQRRLFAPDDCGPVPLLLAAVLVMLAMVWRYAA